jgi:hypothetical protein
MIQQKHQQEIKISEDLIHPKREKCKMPNEKQKGLTNKLFGFFY